jgi:hypothetical protein
MPPAGWERRRYMLLPLHRQPVSAEREPQSPLIRLIPRTPRRSRLLASFANGGQNALQTDNFGAYKWQ